MLTLQFVPYHEIENLNSANRVKKLLRIVKDNKIVLLEGQLRKQEEAELIKNTMEQIDDSFKGIELGVLHQDNPDAPIFRKIRNSILNLLLGDRKGLTIIGPATVVKEIKQDPEKIQLFTQSGFPKKKKKLL